MHWFLKRTPPHKSEFTLTVLARDTSDNEIRVVRTVTVTKPPELHLDRLLCLFAENVKFLDQHGYSLFYARCNF